MKQLLFALLLFTQLPVFSQNNKPTEKFDVKIMEVKGDLNKDMLEDMVVVSQDTINDRAPYRIQIFFAQPSGKLNLVASSDKLIEAQFPDGREGYRTGDEFSEVIIKRGVLSVKYDLLRGNYVHKFRYQNGDFEVIGFSSVSSDGQGIMTSTDFNLSTGVRIEKKERYDIDKVLSTTQKKVIIRPLPKLQDVIPFENELY